MGNHRGRHGRDELSFRYCPVRLFDLVLLGDGGRELTMKINKGDDETSRSLYGAPQPAGWAAQYASREHEREYGAPPPNWRD